MNSSDRGPVTVDFSAAGLSILKLPATQFGGNLSFTLNAGSPLLNSTALPSNVSELAHFVGDSSIDGTAAITSLDCFGDKDRGGRVVMNSASLVLGTRHKGNIIDIVAAELQWVTQALTPPPLPPLPVGPAPLPPAVPSAGSLRPHILLFVIDDMGWANIGFHNGDHVHTPNLDREAAAGVKLNRSYAFNWCAPSRAALATGRMPYHVLETTNYVSGRMNMLAAKLKQVGYTTTQLGKASTVGFSFCSHFSLHSFILLLDRPFVQWHMGELMTWMTPSGRGFHSSLGYLCAEEDHYTHRAHELQFGCPGTDLWRSGLPAAGYNGTYSAHLYGAEAVSIIQNHNRSKPLFLYVALQDMHAPNQVPGRFSSAFPSPAYNSTYATYNGMGIAADEVFGNVTRALRMRQMYSTSFIVVTSDNGGPSGQSFDWSGNNWWVYFFASILPL